MTRHEEVLEYVSGSNPVPEFDPIFESDLAWITSSVEQRTRDMATTKRPAGRGRAGPSKKQRPRAAFVFATALIIVLIVGGAATLLVMLVAGPLSQEEPVATQPAPATTIATEDLPPTLTIESLGAPAFAEGTGAGMGRLVALSSEEVWAASPLSHAGVWHFDGGVWTATPCLEGGPCSAVGMAVGPDGTPWATAWEGSITSLEGAQWIIHDEPGVPIDAEVIAVAPNGDVWASGRAEGEPGIFRLDAGTWTRFTGADAAPLGSLVRSIAFAPDGSVWIGAGGTYGASGDYYGGSHGVRHPSLPGGLARFDGSDWGVVDLPAARNDLPVSSVVVTSAGDVWVAFEELTYSVDQDGGRRGVEAWTPRVARFDGDEWTLYGASDGIPLGVRTQLAASEDGTVWALSSPGAVNRHGAYVKYVPSSDRPTSEFGGPGGVASFNGQFWTSHAVAEPTLDGIAWLDGIAVAPDGTVFVAGQELHRLTPGN